MIKTLTDADLVKRVREGETEAFTVLVNRYQNAIYGVAYHHLGDFEDAHDVAQETFIRAYCCLHLLDDPDKFGPWLRQVTINQCRMWRRRQKDTESLEAVLPLPHAAEQVDTRVAVQQALACLSEPTRLTITLFYMQAFSLRQIAEFLEVPITTVKSRLRDARARLKQEMCTMVEATMNEHTLPEGFAQKITLSPITDLDMPTLEAWFQDEELRRRLGGMLPLRRYFDYVASEPDYHAWMVWDQGVAVGAAVMDIEPDVPQGFAYLVNPQLRNRGYGSRIARALLERPEAAQAKKFEMCVEPDNEASIRCLESIGFTKQSGLDAEGFLHLVLHKD